MSQCPQLYHWPTGRPVAVKMSMEIENVNSAATSWVNDVYIRAASSNETDSVAGDRSEGILNQQNEKFYPYL